tara:strand:+ start:1430 stop:2125 length:696 start_codon:yes stop_codon:yes gene_type:complete
VSRARDLASSGVTSTVLSAKAPLASPDFTGTVDLTGTTISLDNDQISGDKVSGGTIGAGTFSGTIGSSATFPSGHVLQVVYFNDTNANVSSSTANSWSNTGLTKTITTKVNNSDIYFTANQHIYLYNHTSDGWHSFSFRIMKDEGSGASQIWKSNTNTTSVYDGYYLGRYTDSDEDRQMSMSPIAYLDTGNSTNAGTTLTYTLQVAQQYNYGYEISYQYANSHMTLMEIMP